MERVTLEQAVQLLLEHTPVVAGTEDAGLLQMRGRVLAQDMVAAFDNPPFDRSPIDGYACRAEDIVGASKEAPAELDVIAEIDAGQYLEMEVKRGQAVRIMTGAAIPTGCDCCIRQEDTDYGEQTVKVYVPQKKWDNYCFAGEDFKKDTVLLEKGTKLGYVEAAVLAGMGICQAPVYRLPKVALLTSGDEVVEPGRSLPPGKIYNSNMTMLAARLQDFGICPFYTATVQDEAAVMAKTLQRTAREADLIITTGAVSVGKKDIMHEALRQIGAERIFWRVQIKPGMPTLFSVYQGVPILSLSGNPFGVAVTAEVLLRPLLQKMMRDDSLGLVRVNGVMADTFAKKVRGRRFVRAIWENGTFHLPKGLHSNGVLSSMAGCNCLIEVRPGMPALEPGVRTEAILL